jgi:hypothetical protein
MVHKKNHAQTSPKTIKLATSIRDGPCFSYSKKYRPGRKEKLQHNSMFQNRSLYSQENCKKFTVIMFQDIRKTTIQN